MPEGHLAHHLAREHAAGLTGPVRATSPQGRFAPEAAALDGGRLAAVEPYGKHLFYIWEDGPVVHLHLGLLGRFLHHAVPPPDPRGQVRLRLVGGGLAVDLVAPARCELTDAAGRAQVVSRLGPDPLRTDGDPDRAWEHLRRSGAPLGALLLDQSVIAGVGNVLRAEVLHLAGLHPGTQGRTLTREDFDRLWAILGEVMRRATAAARIVTREPPPGVDAAGLADADLRRVYKRQHCGVCGHAVDRWLLAGRDAYACPACQPPPEEGCRRPAPS